MFAFDEIALVNKINNKKTWANLESVGGSVIKAAGTVEFEDGFRMGADLDGSPPCRLLVSLWRPHQSKNQFQTPLGMRFGPRLGVGVLHFRPNSNLLGSTHWWY